MCASEVAQSFCFDDPDLAGGLHNRLVQRDLTVERARDADTAVVADHRGLQHIAFKLDDERNHAIERENNVFDDILGSTLPMAALNGVPGAAYALSRRAARLETTQAD